MLVEIPDSPAVGNEISVKAPFTQLAHKKLACAGAFSVYPVVCAHYAFDLCFLNKGFKCGKIGFLHVLLCSLGVKFMPYGLRTAVNGKMLCAGSGFHDLSVTLQTSYICLAVFGCKERIFAISLMTSAPSRVSENVDVGSPESKSLVNVPVIVFCVNVVFCPRLGGGDVSRLFHKFGVKHGSHTDSLRKHCCNARTCKTVETLIPPVIRRNAQSRDRRSIVSKLTRLLLNGHFINQSFRSFKGRKRFVKIFFHFL